MWAEQIFPRGLMGSPDLKFILEAIVAASDLIKIAVDRMYPRGALKHLPWRYYALLSYSSVFLIKACAASAVVEHDRPPIILLLKRLIAALATSSSDDQHPGVRYARLLSCLLKTVAREGESVSITRPSSPKMGGDEAMVIDGSLSRQGGPSGAATPAATRLGERGGPSTSAGGLFGDFSSMIADTPGGGVNLSALTDGSAFGATPSAYGGAGASADAHGLATSTLNDHFPDDRHLNWDLALGVDDATASGASDALSYLLNKNALDSLWQSFGQGGDAF